jgi:SAM-dependent MidA family methyltransferase
VPVEGGIYDVSPAAAIWFGEACRGLERGYTILIDYGYQAGELYRDHRLTGSLRGYYGHTVTDDPFNHIGDQDLTIHVDFSALQRAGESAGLQLAGLTTQGAMLASLGLGDLLMDMQREPGTRMDEYLATQAVVLRLIDPGGLGRFRVQVMAKGAPVSPRLRLFNVEPPAF